VRNRLFNGEVAIHLSGFDGLHKPIVWAFPKLTVCLDCGQAKFLVPKKKLQTLVAGSAATKCPPTILNDEAFLRSIMGTQHRLK